MNINETLQVLYQQNTLRNVDFSFSQLLQRLGASPEVMLAGALAMRAITLGHSGFLLNDAKQLIIDLGGSRNTPLPNTEQWRTALLKSPLVAQSALANVPLNFEEERVSLQRYAAYEADLVKHLMARRFSSQKIKITPPTIKESPQADLFLTPEIHARSQAAFPATLDTLKKLFGISPNNQTTELDRQALAACVALQHSLLLVTGGPGTGKTTTVARLLAVLASQHQRLHRTALRIALAAPTGRAAARMGEALQISMQRDLVSGRLDSDIAAVLPRDTYTLHRLLGWRSGKVAFEYNELHPLPFDVVVVDEASMIDLPMMSKLVAAIAPDTRLILLGDPDQLPAVEAGNVLGALCQAAGSGEALPQVTADWATELLRHPVPVDSSNSPLSGHRVHLLRGYRQAGAATLAELALAIRDGKHAHVWQLLKQQPEGLEWHHGNVTMLESLLKERVLPKFKALAKAESPQHALQQASEFRVLTALRGGNFGADAWNAWFVQQLAGAYQPWFHGRFIMITSNSYRHGLYNGDTGIAWREDDGEILVWFELDGRLRSWRPSQLPAHQSAFATTIHKAQGSEFDEIMLLLPDRDARVLTRELLYTGLTRARKAAWLWGTQDMIQNALGRQSHRDTGLLQRFLRYRSQRSESDSVTMHAP